MISTSLIKYLVILNVCLLETVVIAVQSNSTCAPVPKDLRQYMCSCTKQLQLRCSYRSDMLRISRQDLDNTLRPIMFDEVSIERRADPDDSADVNTYFNQLKTDGGVNKSKQTRAGSVHNTDYYLYFPNFKLFNSPYVSITLTRFSYIPSFAFAEPSSPIRRFDSVVFELDEIYDFGIDKYAFHNTKIEDSLIIEGPFNRLSIHRDAFSSAHLNQLVIGCYCIECESFTGECVLAFNQDSVYSTSQSVPSTQQSATTTIKSLKLYSVSLDLSNLTQSLPPIENLEELEITNAKQIKLPEENDLTSGNKYSNMIKFVFKNNQLSKLSQLLKLLASFPNLKILTLSQGKMTRIDELARATSWSLAELNLDRNEIRTVAKFAKQYSKLRILNLGSNQIEKLENNELGELVDLEYLDLSNNKLESLTEKTFVGLDKLKQLILSYNPFKNFEPNAFRHVSNLIRLDLISNVDHDWFMFEDNDVCLLAPFTQCGQLRININPEQTCNCFVKYMNMITASQDAAGSICKYESTLKNLNKFMDESLDDMDDQTSDDIQSTSSSISYCSSEFKPSCSNSTKGAKSCLSSSNLGQKVFNYKSSRLNNKLYMDNSDELSSTSLPVSNTKNDNTNNFLSFLFTNKQTALEGNALFLFVSLIVLFVLSTTSLLIGVYLIIKQKQNKYAYHMVFNSSNGYPNDER